MAETIGITVSSLLVALIFPAYAEKIFAITGATAVCIVCYVIPVGLHLKLHLLECATPLALDLIQQEDREIQALLLPNGGSDADDVLLRVQPVEEDVATQPQQKSLVARCWRTTHQIVMPILVVVVGVSLSVAALFTTCRPWFS